MASSASSTHGGLRHEPRTAVHPGCGHAPVGQVGPRLHRDGVVAARAALAEAGLDWRQIQLVAGADTIRNGYPGFVAGGTFAQKLGWNGVPVSSSYSACASGSHALQGGPAPSPPRVRELALVYQSRHHPT